MRFILIPNRKNWYIYTKRYIQNKVWFLPSVNIKQQQRSLFTTDFTPPFTRLPKSIANSHIYYSTELSRVPMMPETSKISHSICTPQNRFAIFVLQRTCQLFEWLAEFMFLKGDVERIPGKIKKTQHCRLRHFSFSLLVQKLQLTSLHCIELSAQASNLKTSLLSLSL